VSYVSVVQWVMAKHRDEGKEFKFISVEDAIQALHGLSTRDSYYNNQLKVQFENELGEALLADQAAFIPVVDNVLKWCLTYLKAKAERDKTDLKAEFQKMTAMHGGTKPHEKDLFYGRICDAIDELDFYTEMETLFSGGGGYEVHQKCLAIQQFHNEIYEKDYTHQKSATLALMEQLNARALDPTEVRWGMSAEVGNASAENVFGQDSSGNRVSGEGKDYKKPEQSADRRGRYWSDTSHGNTRTESRGLGGPEAEAGAEGQLHGRGIDRWTMDERQPFIQQARLLDMPLAGAISGTTSDLITVALLSGIGTGSKEAFLFVCAALPHFVGAGAHTFHEVVTAATATQFGITYRAGDYHSFFQTYMSALPTVKAMFDAARSGDGPCSLVRGIGKPL
jgi:hypothetical protein